MKINRERRKIQQPLGAILGSYLAVTVFVGLFLLALVLLVIVERFLIG